MNAQAIINRQASQTPRLPQASPAPGTPGGLNVPMMPIQAPQQNNMTAAQMAMLQTQQQNLQQGMNMQAGSLGQTNGMMPSLTPNVIQDIQQRNQLQQQRSHND